MEQRPGRLLRHQALQLVDELVERGVVERHHDARLRAELAVAEGHRSLQPFRDRVSALREGARQDEDRD
jgi:hypothetical protein